MDYFLVNIFGKENRSFHLNICLISNLGHVYEQSNFFLKACFSY